MSSKLIDVIREANQWPEHEQPESKYLYLDENSEEQVVKSTEDGSGNKNKNVKTKLIEDMVVRWNSNWLYWLGIVLWSHTLK